MFLIKEIIKEVVTFAAWMITSVLDVDPQFQEKALPSLAVLVRRKREYQGRHGKDRLFGDLVKEFVPL